MKWQINDIGNFLGIYAVCIISTYFLPDIVNQLFFLLILVLFYRSKDNYFWFALIFFLVDPPGGLFPLADYNYGLAMYNFLPGVDRPIYFQELFIFIALYKAWRLRIKPRIVFQKPLKLLLFYFIFLFLLSFVLGITSFKLFSTIRNVLPWTLIFSITVLMQKQEDWLKFFNLIFLMLFVSVGSQLMYIILNMPPAYLLGTNFAPVMYYGEIDYEAVSLANPENLRPISSSFISLFSLMGSMFYLLYNRKTFNNNYLFLITILAYFSILVTATRGWIIAFSVMIVFFLLGSGRMIKRSIQLSIFILIAASVLLSLPQIQNQVNTSLVRLGLIERISEGDLTAGGTLRRLDEYSPRVMAKFYESPIIGWGFSDQFHNYSNGHVGNQNLLLNAGVIGYLIFVYFWFKICFIPINIRNKLSASNPFRRSLLIIPILFVGLFILHSTSGQLFQYMIGFYSGGFGQVFFYVLANFYVIEAIKFHNESSIDQKSNLKE